MSSPHLGFPHCPVLITRVDRNVWLQAVPSEDGAVGVPPAGGSWPFLRSLTLDSWSRLVFVGEAGFPVHLGSSGWFFPFGAFTSWVPKAGRWLQ